MLGEPRRTGQGLHADGSTNKVNAVLVQPSQIIGTHRVRLAALAAHTPLPTMGVASWWCEGVWVMSYTNAGP